MARRLATWLGFLLLIAVALTPRQARCEPQRATLTLTRERGAETCLEGGELQKQVDALAGVPVLVASAGIAVSVTIRPVKRGYLAHIVLSGERTGERTLDDEGPGCDVLGRALVVAVAILLDAAPGVVVDPPLPPAPLPPAPLPPPRSAKPPPRRAYFDLPEVPTVLPERRPRATQPFFSASLAAIYDVGTLVDDAGGFTLGVDFWIPHFGIGGALVVLPFDRLQLTTREIDYSLVAGRVELCSKPPFSLPFGVAVCSGLAAGERRAAARGDDAPAASSGAVVSFESRLELSSRFLGPFGVLATAGFGAPLLDEPVDVLLPNRARPISGPDSGVTFQTGLGARFWLDL